MSMQPGGEIDCNTLRRLAIQGFCSMYIELAYFLQNDLAVVSGFTATSCQDLVGEE
ncbi:hypothetical protein PAXRUDRAFT_835077 [Paxillus rubicundulus Ve08.2h10]|uniref:Uncharacterized protein n=1 Tax=Paxillus rubicundulus Ve08.2h10 TaxID=930991 RepID=A0A0D0C1T0_9AGAM|nr:hypothetical protein PAXRUDRAFT_835077 [Paxillus rubicundulus Ve08.2h10]